MAGLSLCRLVGPASGGDDVAMIEEGEYRVTEAVLVKRDDGSAWRLTFTPESSSSEASIEILLSPERVDDMFFAVTYTLAEVEALAVDEPG